MLKIRMIVPLLLAALAVGPLSVTHAAGWDGYYNQHPNHNGDFTNSEAWSANIVDFDRESCVVVRYGERVRLRLISGHPRLYIGQRVRVVPFRRDGRYEIGELRLVDHNWAPVATVRYLENRVPKGRPYYGYDRAYGPRPGGYYRDRGPEWGIDVWIQKDAPRRNWNHDGRGRSQKKKEPPRGDRRPQKKKDDPRGPRRPSRPAPRHR